jgi:hypothetical protein
MVSLILLLNLLILLIWPYTATPTLYCSLGVLYLLLILLTVRWYVMNRMFTYYERVIPSQRGKVEHIKLAVNSLIGRLAENLKRECIPPKKYRLHLFNTDYNGIKVLKKPGWLRDYYLCEVIVEGEECNY